MNRDEWIRRDFGLLIDKAMVYHKTVYFENDKLKIYIKVFDKLAIEDTPEEELAEDSSQKLIGEDVEEQQEPPTIKMPEIPTPKEKAKHPKLIKKMYKKLAVVLHPDRGGNNEEFNHLVTSYDNNDIATLIILYNKHCTFDDFNVEEEDVVLISQLLKSMDSTIQEIKNTIAYRLFDPTVSQSDKIRTVQGVCSFTGKSFEEVVNLIMKGTELITEQLENG